VRIPPTRTAYEERSGRSVARTDFISFSLSLFSVGAGVTKLLERRPLLLPNPSGGSSVDELEKKKKKKK
jgi:hypothetical protein